jgi:4-hydroxybenzoate polyprenyltransferase
MSFSQELRHFPDFVKLSHSVFALPFALAALLLASGGLPKATDLALVIAALVTARTAAMAFNRIVDRKIDAENPRTAVRHIPSGAVSLATAWMIVAASTIAFIAISFSINRLAGYLSPVALLIIFGYSFTKRFTNFSHFVLGIALGLAPIGAWVAVQMNLESYTPWLLGIAVVLWVAGFDIIYAIQDSEFDRNHGLHSMVVKLGEERALRLVGFLHSGMFVMLVFIGLLSKLAWFYYCGLAIVLLSLAWEQWLIRRLNQGNLQLAFLQANAGASFGYLIAVVMGIYL